MRRGRGKRKVEPPEPEVYEVDVVDKATGKPASSWVFVVQHWEEIHPLDFKSWAYLIRGTRADGYQKFYRLVCKPDGANTQRNARTELIKKAKDYGLATVEIIEESRPRDYGTQKMVQEFNKKRQAGAA